MHRSREGAHLPSLREVVVTSLRIGYRRCGDGPPVVLLHGGFGFDSRSWSRQFAALCGEFTVLAWDAPGCGGSADPPDGYTMADYADRLAEFLGAIGVDHPHVLGLSFGGTLALALYDRHPDLSRTLILAGAYAGWAGSLPDQQVRERIRRLDAELNRPAAEWIAGYAPGMLTAAAPLALVAEVTDLMSGIRPAANRTMLHAMADTDLRHVLPRITVPTLVLHGDADARAPLPVGRRLHDDIPGSQLVVLPATGHLSNVESPGAFNDAVRRYLHEHPA